MTNREKYAKQILDIACGGHTIGVDKKAGKPIDCHFVRCRECRFDDCFRPCDELRAWWCNSEYVEPPIDWSKVPVDTPILVRDSENEEWKHRYFSVFRNGAVYAWKSGRTSWSAYIHEDFEVWEYAKLAEESETE